MINRFYPVVLILLLVGVGIAQTSEITPQKWAEIKSQFKEKYASESPAERLAAIQLIYPCWGFFTDKKNAVEALQLLIDVLERETDSAVLENALTGTARTSLEPETLNWLDKNYDSLKNETGKIRLIEILGRFTSQYDRAVKLLTSSAADKNLKIRLAVVSALARLPVKYSFDPLISMISDKELTVAIKAVEVLSNLLDYETITRLVDLLDKESRKEVKEKIVQILETITGVKQGDKKEPWLKWLKERAEKKIDQKEVDEALKKAKDFFLQKFSGGINRSGELVFYALIHAGASPDEGIMKSDLEHYLTKKLERTYNVALLALTLSDLDAVKYKPRLVQCAQFLLGNESEMGNWHYGKPLADGVYTPITETLKAIETGGKPSDRREKKQPTQAVKKLKIKVPARRTCQATDWDNSNTQYAILGLWACARAGIEIPKEAWEDAEKHLLRTFAGGGWGYRQGAAYGSMTAGGLAALAICLKQLGKNMPESKQIKAAQKWLETNFTVQRNPKYGNGETWHYYYLYALERGGILSETEFFGKYEWYQIGARYLLDKQKKDGSWKSGETGNEDYDTAFAILFLRRATKFPPPMKPIETGAEK